MDTLVADTSIHLKVAKCSCLIFHFTAMFLDRVTRVCVTPTTSRALATSTPNDSADAKILQFDEALLKFLVCPLSKTPLRYVNRIHRKYNVAKWE